jgi:hypothetical protein
MILSKSQLLNNINAEISDQSYGQISPYDIRHNLIDIVDSIHNLTLSNDLKSLNFATFPTGNTVVGQSALENFKTTVGSTSSDNTAIGNYALRSSYQSSKNTAVGSQSLSCNVYGEGNIGVGYNALGGNTVGHLNIGIGNFALNNNKSGQGNIAIGHGAGYYTSKNTSHQLFIGYHPVDEQHICDNPHGDGWMPLIYGDLSSIKLGIGTRILNNYGILHVGGNILPSGGDISTLGHSLYPWKNLYLSKSIEFSNLSSIFSSGTSLLISNNSIYPSTTEKYNFGSPVYSWCSGYFKDLVVTGRATINELITLQSSVYTNKILYLATNNGGMPILSDDQLNDGGILLKSTTTYQSSPDVFSLKEYKISFQPQSEGVPCFAGDFNATWYSNINFKVPSDRYIQTNNIISYDISSLNNGDCFGLFFKTGRSYISRKKILNINPSLSEGHIAGIGNVNFISNSGEANDYSLSISSLESGVNVSQRFLTGTKSRIKDITNNNKDKLCGFEIKYIDNFNNTRLNDRLVFGSYNNTSNFVNGLILMKDSTDGAVLSVTNIPEYTEYVLPNTIFNVRSKNDCVARFTAESNGYYKASIELLGGNNCLSSGLEIAYLNNSGIADFNIYKNELKTNAIRITDSGTMGIFSSGITNEVITIGHSGMRNIPAISLKDSQYITDINVIPSSGYGKIYNIKNDQFHAKQHNNLVFMDSSGNSFNLVVNKNDSIDGRAVFTNSSGNTFAGYESPSGRFNINDAVIDNTSYGYRSLYRFRSGSGNISIGTNALDTLVSGNNNLIIGKYAGSGLVNSYNNIVIGNLSFNRQSELINTSGNIIIGNNGVGNSVSGSYNFALGYTENIVLLEGKLGPTNNDKRLILPSGGKLYINNNDNTEGLCIKSNVIEIIDSGGSDYPENTLTFTFIGNKSSNLLTLDHNAASSVYAGDWRYPTIITNSNVKYNDYFWFPTSGQLSDLPPQPYARLNGNLQIKGNIQFADGTYIGSTKPIQTNTLLANSGIDLGNSGIKIAKNIETLFIEGFMPTGLPAPSIGQKTSGIMIPKDYLWADSGVIFITNRDTSLVVQTGAYVIAAQVNSEYKPIWISSEDTSCSCCNS